MKHARDCPMLRSVRRPARRLTATLFACLSLASGVWADERVQIEASEEWSCFFGGQEVSLHYRVLASGDFEGRVSYAIAVQDATVARREVMVRATRHSPDHFTVRLTLPEARPGIIVPVSLSLSTDGAPEQVRRLWIFPKDAFFNRRKLLEELKIALFDPAGRTARRFEKENIPFRQLHDIDALAAVDSGLLLIAEGVSFREYRNLPDILAKRAAAGISVLCFAPSGGRMRFPGSGKDGEAPPTRLLLRRADVIHEFDKRLDFRAWPPDGTAVVRSLVLTSDRSGPIGEMVEGDSGWPWLEADFATSGGKLVICGFGIIEKWDSGPAPRHLLANLLERMGEEPQKIESEKASGKR